MTDPIATSLIVKELLDRPGQSKYSLASHLYVPPMLLEDSLSDLADRGVVLQSDVEGDDEPVFWASQDAADDLQVVLTSEQAEPSTES